MDVNRSEHIRRDDNEKNFSIKLINHVEALMYYFQNVIKPKVKEQGRYVDVPVLYGSPERWKSVQRDGFYRDQENVIITPLIMFRRTSVEKNRELSRNLDANNPQLHIAKQQSYTKYNRYDKFSLLNNTIPQVEFHRTIVPDYVTLQFEGSIWTNYISQMDELIEMIQYAESSYWGDMKTFRFLTKINSFSESIDIGIGEDRNIKTTFDMTVNGFLIPTSVQKELSQPSQKLFSMSKIRFNEQL